MLFESVFEFYKVSLSVLGLAQGALPFPSVILDDYFCTGLPGGVGTKSPTDGGGEPEQSLPGDQAVFPVQRSTWLPSRRNEEGRLVFQLTWVNGRTQ